MTNQLIMLLIVDLLVFAPIGAWLAQQRGRTPAFGALVGAVFGILGIIVLGLAPPPKGLTRTCPRCAEDVKYAAVVCRYCGTALSPIAAASGPLNAAGQALPNHQCGRCGKPLSPVWVGNCKHCGARYADTPPVART